MRVTAGGRLGRERPASDLSWSCLGSRIPPQAAPPPVLLFLLALVAWLPASATAGFAGDDRELLRSPLVEGALSPLRAFDRDYFHHLGGSGQYRPLATLALRAERALLDRLGIAERPAGYHAANALLHASVVLLAALVLVRASPRAPRWPWFGLACFAVHPALADSVAWISGIPSLLSACAGTAGAYALLRALDARPLPLALPISALGLCAALGAKEDGLVFGALYAALAWRHSPRALAWSAAGSALALALYLAARDRALAGALLAASHPVLPEASARAKLELGGAALLEALRLAALPLAHPPQYRVSYLLERAGSLGPWLAWLWLGASAAWVLRSCVRAPSLAASSLGLALLAFLPFLHLVPLGEAFAPRFLYLPLLCGAPFVHALWMRLPWRAPLALLALCAWTALAWQRASVYAGREAYRLEVLRHIPGDAPSWNDLGIALDERGDDAGARAAWERATSLDPQHSRAWTNLGGALLRAGEPALAEQHLRRAVASGPRNAIAHSNLASLCLRTGRAEQAEQLYRRACELAPGLAPAWRGLGRALLALGRGDEAQRALERALELDPADSRALQLLERAQRN